MEMMVGNLERLKRIINRDLPKGEFKNSLIFALCSENDEMLLEELILSVRSFLLSTDVYNELKQLEDSIKQIHELRQSDINPEGERSRQAQQKIRDEANKLYGKVIGYIERHGSDIPLPMVAKGLSDTTRERHSGIRAFQIIKEVLRFLIGLYNEDLQQVTVEDDPIFVDSYDFLVLDREYLIPQVLLDAHLKQGEQSRTLLVPTIRGKEGENAYPNLIEKMITVQYQDGVARNTLNDRIQYLLDIYEEKERKNLGEKVACYQFSPLWVHLYALIFKKVANSNPGLTVEFLAQLAANTTMKGAMDIKKEDEAISEQVTTEILMSIVGAFIMLNTFFSKEKQLTVDIEDAPLFIYGQRLLAEKSLTDLANIFKSIAFPDNKRKITNINVQNVLYTVFSSEASRLYTFRHYRYAPSDGRVHLIEKKPLVLTKFENELIEVIKNYHHGTKLLSKFMAQYSNGREAKVALDQLEKREIQAHIEKKAGKELKKA